MYCGMACTAFLLLPMSENDVPKRQPVIALKDTNDMISVALTLVWALYLRVGA